MSYYLYIDRRTHTCMRWNSFGSSIVSFPSVIIKWNGLFSFALPSRHFCLLKLCRLKYSNMLVNFSSTRKALLSPIIYNIFPPFILYLFLCIIKWFLNISLWSFPSFLFFFFQSISCLINFHCVSYFLFSYISLLAYAIIFTFPFSFYFSFFL